MNGPVAIDIYHGNNVQDLPGALGGFARVKAYGNGIAFLLHKATEGLNFVDDRYSARRAAWMNGGAISVTDVDGTALKLAPRFAAYHLFHGEDPEGEAKHFLKNADLNPGDDAVVDWEEVGSSSFQPSADAVDAFCNAVEKVLGFRIIVYSGNVAKEQLGTKKDARFAKRRLWLAQYSNTFQVQASWSFPWLWQNNGDAAGPGPSAIDGIDGNCDNSTVAPPMTVKRLFDEWAGGVKPPSV
jgi:lysozyme